MSNQNVIDETRAMLAKHAPWVIRFLAIKATPKQEPRDLIAEALRAAGYDIFASAAKATEIVRAAANESQISDVERRMNRVDPEY